MKKENSGEIVMYQPKDINTHFLRVDGEVYHIGASIKDLGKKWFAFTLMHDITPSMLAEHLSEKGALTLPMYNYLKINNLHISGAPLACLVHHQASSAKLQ